MFIQEPRQPERGQPCPRGRVWTFTSPNGAPSQSPTLSRDCGTTLGSHANTTATPTGLRLLSRTCGSLLVIWLRPHELERGDETQPRWGWHLVRTFDPR